MNVDHGVGQEDAGFGALLRERRRAAGLTQAELAARAGVGVRTIRELERGRSARPQRTTVDLLCDALELSGEQRGEFVAAARRPAGPSGDAPRVPTMIALPPAVPLVGRDADLAHLADLLAERIRLITLVGLAGAGKSSLALALAHHLLDRYPAGVGGVIVTEAAGGADLLSIVASVFGVGRAEDLPARLGDSPALLLLDAVERAPAAAAEATGWLLRAAPGLSVVATGRHPMNLPEEHAWPVGPLEVPPSAAPGDLATLAGFPAVALFLGRLRRVRRAPVADAETGALVKLVRRLGGLPLALELAAARGRVLDLNEMLDRYGDRVLDLAGPPEAPDAVAVTLRDAVAASYRLLEPPERHALRWLSVFRNRWSVEFAEALLGGDGAAAAAGPAVGDPVPLLDRLLELGLVSVRGSGQNRFRLVDVVRDFAAEQAVASGELVAARRRHAVVLTRWVDRVAPLLAGAEAPAAVAQLDDMAADLWAALGHAADHDPPTALRLAVGLVPWWRFRGRGGIGRRWLRRLLDDPRTDGVAPGDRTAARRALDELAREPDGSPGRATG